MIKLSRERGYRIATCHIKEGKYDFKIKVKFDFINGCEYEYDDYSQLQEYVSEGLDNLDMIDYLENAMEILAAKTIK